MATVVLDIAQLIGGDGEVTLKRSIVADLPAAADVPYAMRFVTDAGAGNVLALVVSNGTAWVDMATGAAVVA